MISLKRWLVVLALLTGWAAADSLQPDEVPNPRQQGAWVSDAAQILPEPVEAELNRRLERLEKETSCELTVVTLPHCGSRTSKAFATALFNYWGVGKRGANNGVLYLIVIGKRRMEIEVGTGLESTLPSKWCTAMLEREAVPQFRAGAPERGVTKAVEQIVERLDQAPLAHILPVGGSLERTAARKLERALTGMRRPVVLVPGNPPPAGLSWRPRETLYLFYRPGRKAVAWGPGQAFWQARLDAARDLSGVLRGLQGRAPASLPNPPAAPPNHGARIWDLDGRYPPARLRALQERLDRAGKPMLLVIGSVESRERSDPRLLSWLSSLGELGDWRWLNPRTGALIGLDNSRSAERSYGADRAEEVAVQQLLAGARRDRAGQWTVPAGLTLDHRIERAIRQKGWELVVCSGDPRAEFLRRGLGSNGWVISFQPDSGAVAQYPGESVTSYPLAGNFGGATVAERWRGLLGELTRTLAPAAPPEPPPVPQPVPVSLLGLTAVAGWGAFSGYRRYFKARMCPQCRRPLIRYSESEDDDHLSSEEVLEESLGSVDYWVFYCPDCSHSHTEVYPAWLTSYSNCPQCARRTMSSTSQTLEAATYDYSGRGLRVRDCRNCSFHDEQEYHIPRLQRSESSSDSSSSSGGGGSSGFGGGSSSGGGGGASW